MAFLDNSGDIILAAGLAALGRKRLASGNFNIAKFALGDEEVNYALYDSSDARGSAFYDLQIMQTPILEAFTSDQSLMKSRLLTLVDDSLLYLPILRLNDKATGKHQPATFNGTFYVTADARTYNLGEGVAGLTDDNTQGWLRGTRGTFGDKTTHIAIDQGIDAGDSNLTIADTISGELLERAFIVKMDHRLLELDGFVGVDQGNAVVQLYEQFIDDDNIATYYIVDSQNQSPIMGPRDEVSQRERHTIPQAGRDPARLSTIGTREMFDGPLGSILRLTPRASAHVARGESLFDELGFHSTTELAFRGGKIKEHKRIDTSISITGATTGFQIDIPIRIIKGLDFEAPPQ